MRELVVDISPYFNFVEPMKEVEVDNKELSPFMKAIEDIVAIHMLKQADYGRTADSEFGHKADPFANIRSSEEWGIPGWVGALVRGNDKIRRLQAVSRGQNLKNESVEDSLLDLATYATIALAMYRESLANNE